MNLITIDFETYYDKDYTLSKLTTQGYILDTRFEVIGVAVKLNHEPTQWFHGSYMDVQKFLSGFPWDDAIAVAHNALFDFAILGWHFGIYPKHMFCTMQGSRPFLVPFIDRGRMSLAKVAEYLTGNLNNFKGKKGNYVANAIGMRRKQFTPHQIDEYGKYCINDVELTYYIAAYLIPLFSTSELKLLHLNIRKFTKPALELDRMVLRNFLNDLKEEREAILKKANIQDVGLLRSNDKFAAILKLLGVTPPTKISPVTGKETYAFAKTDNGMIALQEHEDTAVQAVVAARLNVRSTIAETRAERFLSVARLPMISDSFGRNSLAVPLLYYGAHTGRLSGFDKLNMQNLSRGSKLREAITVPVGKKMVVGDLSQIEARIAACLAGQMDLVRAFANDEDVYCEFATKLYKRPITAADYAERFVGKCTVLSCQYGVGYEKLAASVNANPNVEITLDEAIRTVNTYRNVYFKLPELWKEANGWLEYMTSGAKTPLKYKCLEIHPAYQRGRHEIAPAILLPNGMPIYYPNLHKGADNSFYYTGTRNPHKKIYGAAVLENVCQALARVVLAEAELRMAEAGKYAANQVHDELIYVCDETNAQLFAKALETALTHGVDWMPELPVACEVAIGDNYREAK